MPFRRAAQSHLVPALQRLHFHPQPPAVGELDACRFERGAQRLDRPRHGDERAGDHFKPLDGREGHFGGVRQVALFPT